MSKHSVQPISTQAAARTAKAAPTPTHGAGSGQARAEQPSQAARGDQVNLSDDIHDDAGSTPLIDGLRGDGAGLQKGDGPEGKKADARGDKKDDKKTEDADAEAQRQKLEELNRKKAELEKQLENQTLAGDQEGAQATRQQLDGLNQEIKQLVEAAQGGGANPIQRVAPPPTGAPPAKGAPPPTGAPPPPTGAPPPPIAGGGVSRPTGRLPAPAPSTARPGGVQAPQAGGGDPTAGARPANPKARIPDFGPNPSKKQIGQMLDGASDKYGIPPNILKAVAYQESTWNHKALSFDGQHGKGVMQIDDRYHQFARTNEVFDPAKNIDYGAKYLSNLYKETGSWNAALKRYNGGSDYPPKIMSLARRQPWKQWEQ